MSRPILAYYLVFSLLALACLQGIGARWPVVGIPAACAVLALGGVLIHRRLRTADAIDVHLRRIAAGPPDDLQMGIVAGAGPTANGWNRLAAVAAQAENNQGLHDRLGEALARYRCRSNDLILDSFPDGVAVTDLQGQITYANPTLASLLLDAEDEDPSQDGATMYECLSQQAAHSDLAPLMEPESQDRSVVIEITRFDLDVDRVLRVARHPLRPAAGEPAAGSHVWSVRDVTQQKLAEKMHTEFVNSATHELRTPMANIKAYAETLAQADELEVEEQKEFCNTINSEVSRLSRLIDDMLSIESMEVGSLALSRQETDVERLLREKVEMARPLMDKKSLSFQVRLPEKLPKMLLDKDKVALAIDNLLGNAAKYTPHGGEVALRVDIDEDTLQIHVQDSGVGISEEELPKVFEKFFRSSDERIREETGTGLGLAMVWEIVHLHGGDIKVQSTLNEGSTFSISLPMG
ncbi:MAG: ATP-binding protein [Pirellulaceae bacterium]